MHLQSSAAALPGGHSDFTSVVLQHAHGRLVQPREGDVGNAARQQRHAVLSLPVSREHLPELAEKERDLGGRRQPFQLRERSEKLQNPGLPHKPLQAAALVKEGEVARGLQHPRCGQQLPEDERARQAPRPGQFVVSRDLCPGPPPPGVRTSRPRGMRFRKRGRLKHRSMCSM